jgi:hypothetical protein
MVLHVKISLCQIYIRLQSDVEARQVADERSRSVCTAV